MNRTKFTYFSFVLVIIMVMILIRSLYLEADPFFMKRLGDIQDEGYWTHNARMKVLFDVWVPDDMSHAIIFSPLYTGFTYLTFKTLGINFFSARLVSAFFSLATILLLYFLLSLTLGKKIAALSTIILGLNYTYLIYNRVGLVETTLSFFLLLSLSWWYYSYKHSWLSVLSGFTFSLAILIKITAIYFAPIFLLLWIIDYYTGKFKLSSFFLFSAATIIPVAIYASFIFIPNLSLYQVNLQNSLAFSHKGITDILISFFRILTNNFWGEISVFLLLIIFFIFVLSTIITALEENSWLSLLNKYHPLILIALCWIIGGIIGLLFSNLHDRRFVMFLIPLSLLAGYSILSWKKENQIGIVRLSEKLFVLLQHRGVARIVLIALWLYPLFSFIYFLLNAYYKLSYSNPVLNNYFLIAFLGANILLSFLATFVLKKWPLQFQKVLPDIILSTTIFILLLPTFILIKNYTHHILLMLDLGSYEARAIITLFMILSISVVLISHLYLRKRNDLVLTPTTGKNIITSYIVVNILFIAISFMFLSFTLTETSKSIASYAQKGEIITGSSANLLSLETEAKPIFYNPYDPDYAILNKDTKLSHQYVLVSTWFDGHSVEEQNLLIYKYRKVTFLKEFPLFLYPNGKPKQIVQLYKIDEP